MVVRGLSRLPRRHRQPGVNARVVVAAAGERVTSQGLAVDQNCRVRMRQDFGRKLLVKAAFQFMAVDFLITFTL